MNQHRSFGIQFMELVLMLFVQSEAESLKITSLSVPPRADPRFDDPEMTCRYEFGSEGLFTVKWYKDEREFYRYLPTYDPQIIQFPTDEVSLSEDGFVQTKTTLEKRTSSPEICNLTSCTIRLVNVSAASAGEYSCEISSERPYFNTDIKSMNLSVSALPTAPPAIEGVASSYLSGEIFSATCLSEPSLPTSVITWSINGVRAPRNTVSNILGSSADRFGLRRSRSEIHFRIEDGHFRGDNSQLNISCEASVPNSDVVKASHVTFSLAGYQRMTLHNQKLEWNSGCSDSLALSLLLAVALSAFITFKEAIC